MTDSDADSGGLRKVGKPADPIWQFFDTVPNPNGGGPLGSSNKLHRVCKGCSFKVTSATVKQGEDHLLGCSKGCALFPDCRTVIQQSRAGKGERKGLGVTGLKRQFTQASIASSVIPMPKEAEQNAINAALLDMLIMCGLSFALADSPWFRRLCRMLRPGFVPQGEFVCRCMCCEQALPGRLCQHSAAGATTYRSTSLDNKHAVVRAALTELLKVVAFPQVLTLTFDGWTNLNGYSVWEFMALLPGIGSVVLETKDASEESHTGEWISGMLGSDLWSALQAHAHEPC